MLRLFLGLIKGALFALAIMALGNWIKIGNRTVSDQVKTEMSHAEGSALAEKARGLANQVVVDVQAGHRNAPELHQSIRKEEGTGETIPSSERQKLKALMRELNSQAGAD